MTIPPGKGRRVGFSELVAAPNSFSVCKQFPSHWRADMISIRCLILLIAFTAVAESTVFNIFRFNETFATEKAARCLDGTTGVFYADPGTGSGRTKWIFYINGGGWCANQTHCLARTQTNLGTSANAPATVDKDGILSDQASQNPDFYTWNRVQLPYCGGDLHSGTRMTNTSEDTWGLWFSGHNIISAMYDVLTAQAGMGAATDIIITGGSAGAVGSWLNTEYTQTRFPSARVVNLPNAGYNTVEEQYPLALGEEKPAALANMSLVWQSKIPPLCDAAFTNVSEKYKCLITEVAINYLTVRRFWIQAVMDTNAMSVQLGFPGFSDSTRNNVTWDWMDRVYRSRLAKLQLQMFTRPQDGWWVTSMLIHVVDEAYMCNQDNVTWLQTFGNWYNNRSGIQREFDQCGADQSVTFYRSGATTSQTSCVAARQCTNGLIAGPPTMSSSPPRLAPAATAAQPSSSPTPSEPSIPSMPTPSSSLAPTSGRLASAFSRVSVNAVLSGIALAIGVLMTSC